SLLLLLAGVGPGPSPKPRLVVVITVDQLRPDYLERYRPQLLGGFAMLLKTGASFSDAYQDHAVTETAPGHSTILSGRWPSHTAAYAIQGRDFLSPHRLPADRGQAALAFIAPPTMDSLTLAFALEGVRALQLGSRGATDLLSVSLSTTNYVGHAYGPDSREIH